MVAIRFRVGGLPPKKDGAGSMWGKPLEAGRLVSLRKAALKAIGSRAPLKSGIRFTLSVHVGDGNDHSVGDLDTFITGICDRLIAAARGCKLCTDVWDKAERDIQPNRPIAISDDCQVVSIQADKTIGNTISPWYEVTLENEQ